MQALAKTYLAHLIQIAIGRLNLIFVGLGGNRFIAEIVCRMVNFSADYPKIITATLIDGDSYELKNASRQEFFRVNANKALDAKEVLAKKYKKIAFRAFSKFLAQTTNEKNIAISEIIRNGDVIFLGPDNLGTRKLVNDYCQKNLKDFAIINAGNEENSGKTQLYLRIGGKDITPDLTYGDPYLQKSGYEFIVGHDDCQGELNPRQSYLTNCLVGLYSVNLFQFLHVTPVDQIFPGYRIEVDVKTGRQLIESIPLRKEG